MVKGDAEGLYVSEIVQEALIEVDEAGSRAGAATGVSVGITSTSPVREIKEFKADRPLAFAIIDTAERAVLFAGRLVDPRP